MLAVREKSGIFFLPKPVATLQLQDEMRNILVLGLSAYYIRGLTFTHCGNASFTVSHGCYIHHACCSNGCVCWQPDGVLLSYASNNFQCYNQQPYTSTCPTHLMYWILRIIVCLYWSSNRLPVFFQCYRQQAKPSTCWLPHWIWCMIIIIVCVDSLMDSCCHNCQFFPVLQGSGKYIHMLAAELHQPVC